MAGIHNFKIEQGATFNPTLTWKDEAGTPYLLSTWTARMQIRTTIDSPDVVLELTKENGKILLSNTSPNISLLVDALTTSSLSILKGVYDLELVEPSGKVHRLLKGKITVDPEVTR